MYTDPAILVAAERITSEIGDIFLDDGHPGHTEQASGFVHRDDFGIRN